MKPYHIYGNGADYTVLKKKSQFLWSNDSQIKLATRAFTLKIIRGS